jgi:hypothetical protein
MKKHTLFSSESTLNFSKIFTRSFLILSVIIFCSIDAQGVVVKQYTPKQMSALSYDLEAGNVDICELTVSGGTYTLKSYSGVNLVINKNIIIRAAKDLAAKPIIKLNTSSAGVQTNIFYTNTPNLSISFEGVEFNGIISGSEAQPILLSTGVAAVNCKIIVKDCYIHHFKNSKICGIFFIIGAGGTSFDMQRTLVDNCFGRLIQFYSPTVVDGEPNYGDLTLINNTFSNTLSDVYNTTDASNIVHYRAGAPGLVAKGTNAIINHCTFYNFKSSTSVFVFRRMSGSIKITNSIFDKIEGGLNLKNPLPEINSCYLAGFTAPPTVASNTFTASPSPEYTDVSNLNFKLVNSKSFVCEDASIVGNTVYYK